MSGCSFSWSSSQGKTISPNGSAYSYDGPHGFFIQDRSDIAANPYRYYESGVYFPTGAIAIRVSQQTLTALAADTPEHAAKIEAAFVDQSNRWTNPATAWRNTTVAGASALGYHLSGQSLDGKRQEDEEVAVFSGRHLVYVSCNWEIASERDTALAGCNEVLESLQLRA